MIVGVQLVDTEHTKQISQSPGIEEDTLKSATGFSKTLNLVLSRLTSQAAERHWYQIQ